MTNRPCLSLLVSLALLTACDRDAVPVGAGRPDSEAVDASVAETALDAGAEVPPGPLPRPAGTIWAPCEVLGAAIERLSASSDGRYLAVAQADGLVSVVRLEGSPQVRRVQVRQEGGAVAPLMELTEDGGSLVTAVPGALKIHTVGSGELRAQVPLPPGQPISLELTDEPSPTVLVTIAPLPGSPDPRAHAELIRWADAGAIASLRGGARATFTFADAAVVLVDEDGGGHTVIGLDGQPLLRTRYPEPLTRIAFAADGAYLAGMAGAAGREELVLVQVREGRVIWRAPGVGTRQILFLENPSRIVRVAELGAEIHDHLDGKVLLSAPALGGATMAIAAPDGSSIAAVDGAGRILLVATADGSARKAPVATFGLTGDVRDVVSSRAGRLMAVVGQRYIWVVDPRNGALLRVFDAAGVDRVDLSDDGLIAMGGARRLVHRIADGETLLELPVAAAELSCRPSLLLAPRGGWLASGTCGRIEGLDQSGARLFTLTSPHAHAIAISPDGERVGTVGPELFRLVERSSAIRAWSMSEGVRDPRAGDRVVFSRDGTRLLVVHGGMRAQLHAANDGAVMAAFGNDLGPAPDLSPDGDWVVAGPRLHHVPTLAERMLSGPVERSWFLPDGRVITSSATPSLRIHCPTP